MRSIFGRLLISFVVILALSISGFIASALLFAPTRMQQDQFLKRLVGYEFDGAVRAYETAGARGLHDYMQSLTQQNGHRYFLLDAAGRDLATGQPRSDLLNSKTPPRQFPPPSNIQFKRRSDDGRYVFLIELHVDYGLKRDLVTFIWIATVMLVLVYALAVGLARPIRLLRETMLRFGRGDLAVRANLKRKDEIGDLAAAFDQMAERLETLLAAERRLLQDVSHELRSPLTRLSFAVEMVRENPSSDAAFQRVKKEVDRMASLIGDLLQVTRVEGDPASRNNMPIALTSLLDEIVEDCRLEAAALGAGILLQTESECEFTGDPELLRRAIENVVRNAIRYTPAGQDVVVSMLRSGSEILIRVRDFGPGVPADQLQAIFRPFHRVEEDRNRSGGGGAGLGLAIAQRAVLLHHGQIDATLAEPGLQVEIRLPL